MLPVVLNSRTIAGLSCLGHRYICQKGNIHRHGTYCIHGHHYLFNYYLLRDRQHHHSLLHNNSRVRNFTDNSLSVAPANLRFETPCETPCGPPLHHGGHRFADARPRHKHGLAGYAAALSTAHLLYIRRFATQPRSRKIFTVKIRSKVKIVVNCILHASPIESF